MNMLANIFKGLMPKLFMSIDPVTASLLVAGIGGVANIGSSYIGAKTQARGQEQTNAFNAEQAKINREFQERMSRNKHRYEVEDLR